MESKLILSFNTDNMAMIMQQLRVWQNRTTPVGWVTWIAPDWSQKPGLDAFIKVEAPTIEESSREFCKELSKALIDGDLVLLREPAKE